MIQYKKILMTLALLLTAVTGAWAQSTYTITFAANNNTKTVENVTLPKTFQCSYDNADGELDLILKELYGWTGIPKTFCDGETTPNSSDENKVVAGNDNGDHYITINNVFEGTVTITGNYCPNTNVTPYTLEISIASAAPATFPFPITWDATNKTTGFNLPAGNVFMNVEYYPAAEFTDGGAPTGIADIKATTDDDIVKAGTVKNIGSSTTPQGTLMYYAVQSETAPDAPDYDNQGWSDKVPTAAAFKQGKVYVWYYVKGADGDETSTFNDGAITKLGETGYVTLAAPPTYAITLKEGTEDVGEWTISPAEATKGTTITATYSGTKRVKSVKAVKKKAEPAAIINGKFSVSATKQVYFSKGNLRYASGAWSFFDNQYDYYATYSADAWDKFGWSNSTNNFGMSTSTENPVYQGDLVDWGTVPGIGTGWFTLSNSEWGYLFNTRSASTVNSVENARYAKGKVNGVYGIILFPDTYTHPAGVTLPVGINEVGNAGWNGNNYSAADWTAMETAGCVFLPATGYREGTSVQSAGSSCSYRSSSRNTSTTDMVNYVYFAEGSLTVSASNYGRYGQCVRLVQDVK